MKNPLTIGAAANQLGVAAWKVRRLYERGILPPAERIGCYRVIDRSDLPKVGAALRQAGYLGPANAQQPLPEAPPARGGDSMSEKSERPGTGESEAALDASGHARSITPAVSIRDKLTWGWDDSVTANCPRAIARSAFAIACSGARMTRPRSMSPTNSTSPTIAPSRISVENLEGKP